ncbi:enoyl-CoA hydratase/isomerase family protein [Humibacter sp.]|uniref:enoyl-CoA hydratase/isomerase family protein n=1 Tax=Humibacter sp. TaxID=1940291 RepID=UPI002B9246E6|nr:enoyl-CoA hydratase-related protein [Humibacter sp.]HVX09190.1 enoyl-CoA hydratase-related protein [Humibacter sp.]
MSESVTYDVVRGVAWLTIERPEARNALSSDVREGLFAGLHCFNEDDAATVLVVTGAGDKAFCAGGDLKEMAEAGLTVPPPDYVPQPGVNIVVDKPLIAAVNGVAYAGGFLLAQGCDLCVASSSARFAITEVKVGRGVPWAVPLPWLIPPRIAMEMLLTGEPISAARAFDLGLVNQVVPDVELKAAVQGLAERIGANAPLSVRAAKRTVYLGAEAAWAGAYEEAERIWKPVYLSEDAQEGPAAFRDGRAPTWRGC